MNLKFRMNDLRRRSMLLVVVVALTAALLPTAAFASSYGHQGRGWDPGPRPSHHHQSHKHHKHCAAIYKVKRGDTLTKISRHYRVSVSKLAKTNNIKNPNHIIAGQSLCIPR